LTKERRDYLIAKGRAGTLSASEQNELACELEVVAITSLRMEQALSAIVAQVEKQVEECR
jgi:hypothetical protein